MARRFTVAFAAWIGLGVPALAHDFWIAPSGFRPAVGERVSVELLVGQRFQGDAVPRNPEKIEAFFAVDGRGSRIPVEGIDGGSPAGYLRARTEGLAWIGYRSRPTAIEQNGPKFDAYLREEGLDAVALARDRSGTTGLPGKEIYSRCAKALIRVGAVTGDAADANEGFDRILGLPLEIVAESSPFAPAASLPVRVLHEGQPLAGALVGCLSKSDPDGEVRLRTDVDGRARFALGAKGVWLVRVVHMVPAPRDSGADWESLWGSLVFERP